MPIAAVINGNLYAVHSDHLNTPRRLTDANGQVVWQWAYSAFGDEEPTTAKNRFANLSITPNPGTTGISDVVFNIGFMGMYRDPESGLAHNWNRYFDRRTGRYTQPDRIGLGGGPNRYPYANLNPLRFADPDGRFALVIPFIPAAISGADLAIGAAIGGGGYVIDRMLSNSNRPPSGSVPISDSPWSGDHGGIKGALGLGGRDSVYIDPEGNVWVQGPDGTWSNEGPASDYTGSGKASGRRGKDRNKRNCP